ncbi:hypothetical protein PCE31106_03163 [Pandoraea cepalis]|uniref:Uncharacterized protein n=1 Tax=Pandoraea cepalis TaxID=2508294 RepID=A0A5E4WF92_9BURK|nr:hypothetical protein PCE31106_03163 [Pandoraea cepalis]
MDPKRKMKNIKIFEEGNFTRWFRLCLIAAGFSIMYYTFKFIEPSIWSGALLLVGLGIAAVGGMTSRAALLRIKPFDSSNKKARDSYKSKDDEENQSK